MKINGIWLTSHSNYKKFNHFFDSPDFENLVIQPFFENSDALYAVKQSNLDFIFFEEEFMNDSLQKLSLSLSKTKTPWIIKICSEFKSISIQRDPLKFYNKAIHPINKMYFKAFLKSIFIYQKTYLLSGHNKRLRSFIVPGVEISTTSKIPIIKIDEICYIKKNKNGSSIQFLDGKIIKYKVDFKTFKRLTKSYLKFYEIVPDFLVNLDYFKNIIHDKTYNEFNCNLQTGANLVLTNKQYQNLNSVIRIF
jgi:hypothetical protein